MKYILIFLIFCSVQCNLLAQGNEVSSKISIGEIIEIESSVLKENRQIYIHKPEGFWGMDENKTKLPVIYVLDAESQFLHTVATIDFLSAAPLGNDRIPRSIVVGIPNTNRDRDLTPIKGVIANDSSTLETTGGGEDFLKFITEELIPYIDSTYSSSKHRTIIGHSLGGLLVFETLLRKRKSFDNYIAIDPAFGFANESYMQEVIDTLNTSILSNENLFFSAANTRPTFLKEEDLLTDNSDISRLTDIPNRKFLNLADSSKWKINLTAKYYSDENHFSIPQKATIDGLRKFYEYYSFPEITNYYHPRYKDKSDLVERIKNHYKMISAKMGYEVMPMEGYLNSFAFGIAPSGREDLAIALFEYNIEIHPENPVVYNNLAYFYMLKGNTTGALKCYKNSLKLKPDESIREIIESLETSNE